MSYTVIEQDLYIKALKKLSKKYKNSSQIIYYSGLCGNVMILMG